MCLPWRLTSTRGATWRQLCCSTQRLQWSWQTSNGCPLHSAQASIMHHNFQWKSKTKKYCRYVGESCQLINGSNLKWVQMHAVLGRSVGLLLYISLSSGTWPWSTLSGLVPSCSIVCPNARNISKVICYSTGAVSALYFELNIGACQCTRTIYWVHHCYWNISDSSKESVLTVGFLVGFHKSLSLQTYLVYAVPALCWWWEYYHAWIVTLKGLQLYQGNRI